MREVRVLKVGEYLLREKEESTEMYYVQSGVLAVYKTKGDQEVQVGTVYPGELIGEISFLDKDPRSATVKAMDECVLNVIPAEKFQTFMEGLPKWYRVLVRTLTARLRKATAKMRI
ncbi:MAG: cyclic nucleotide-binding domain-containing protein [Bacteriovoracaceae bacterium]|nr:cyclic nucleotide-binding domain-containing protein [Bacteriovoracaceae bacterium]